MCYISLDCCCLWHFYWSFCAFPARISSSSHCPSALLLKWAREGTLDNRRDLGPRSPGWSILVCCFCSSLAGCGLWCARTPRLRPKISRSLTSFSTSSWQLGCLLCLSRAVSWVFCPHLSSWYAAGWPRTEMTGQRRAISAHSFSFWGNFVNSLVWWAS